MKIKVFANNAWQENTIVLYDETGEAVVIDCGCFSREEEQRLADFLVENHLKPVALLNTHLHIDHIFGNNFNTACRHGRMKRMPFGWKMPRSMRRCWV